ncbi:hypothetical protein diail_6385 [Diaporthe ilicicola]|nr:hypothetical protein diail_6385 [Diaporthe ilicicola]
MQCISSLVLVLATAATLVIAVPAPMPAPTAAAVPDAAAADAVSVISTAAQSTATAAAVLNVRGATVDAFVAQCSVGTDSVATCTGAVHSTNVWAGVLDATVDSASS